MQPKKIIVVNFSLLLSIVASAQVFTNMLASAYEYEPDRVVVAVAPAGKFFRGEPINVLPQFGDDIFRLISFNENLDVLDSIDLGGYVRSAAIEADDNQVYLNLEFNNVDNYPVILPDIGIIETGEYTDGSLFVALNLDLEIAWYEFFGASYLSGFWDCDILISGNGNLLFNVGGDHPDFFQYVLVKEYTPDGTFVQEFFQTELVYAIQQDSEGNIYLAGPCANLDANFNGTEVTLTLDYNFYVVKYDPGLDYVWSNFVEEVTCSYIDIVVNSVDEIFLGVSLISGTYFFDDLQVNIGQGLHYILAKIDQSAGSYDWVSVITEPIDSNGSTWNYNNAFLTGDDQGNIYLCGNAQGDLSWNNGLVTSNISMMPFVAKILNSGIVDWVNLAIEYNNFTNVQRVEFSESGCLILGGTGKGLLQFDTVHVDFSGYYGFIARLQLENSTTGISGTSATILDVFPNPAGDEIYINLPGDLTIRPRLTVTNLQGIEVLSINIDLADVIKLDVEFLPKGVYFLRLFDGNKTKTGKFIKG